jgi:hypothetical protein
MDHLHGISKKIMTTKVAKLTMAPVTTKRICSKNVVIHKYLKQVQVMCVAAGICGDDINITAG